MEMEVILMEKEKKTNSCGCHRGDKPDKDKTGSTKNSSVEPLPESSRPRRDGPGGD